MQFIGTGDRILTENFSVGYLYTITFKTGIYINSACIGIGDTFVMFQKAEPDLLFTLNVDTADEVDTIELYDSGGGTNDYDDLSNRPQINSHTLTGNMSGADLGLQDTISDLDTIRAGAAAGATAVQPAALSDYQPLISDLDTIRAGAAAGATAVQPAALATKQDALTTTQLTAVNSGITSTDVAQIETNKNNISSLSKKSISGDTVSHQVTAADTYETVSGISIEVPVGKTITIFASGSYNAGWCKGIEILYTGDSIIGLSETTTARLSLATYAVFKNRTNSVGTVSIKVSYNRITGEGEANYITYSYMLS